MEGLGFVHGGTIPVHQGFLVPSRGARPAVAPRLAGAFRDADRVRGLGEVHAFLVQQAHVLGASRLAHQLPRRIFDAVERPTVFPATVFVSVASGHLTLLAVGQVLQRSLEPALAWLWGRSTLASAMHYFTPKRCATSNKIMYHDKAQVQRAADQSLIERGVELWVYRCEFCGCWHLTHRDPQSSYRHVPLNQQLKPHSRKKGYKPRRR